MPALTKLDIELSATVTLPASNSPLFFSALHDLNLSCESWHPISQPLSRTQMPIITNFSATVGDDPSRQELGAFFASVLSSSAGGRTIEVFSLYLWQRDPIPLTVRSAAPLLCLEDLRPCMALSNLRELYFDIEWNVGLTDPELLTLAAAWPHLEKFYINTSWGWNTPCGITPNGLVQLLHTCPLLYKITLAMDTRGYTELSPSGSLASFEWRPLPFLYSINVLDSIIEEESVPAIAAFFANIPNSSLFEFLPWSSVALFIRPDYMVYRDRWDEVHRRFTGLRS
ncbi:hypothetical protein OG21DRAFT_1510314 [Imleria badia]|nr:hypothetical protein OG21DRAFT_1510314 [Imleria badia]